MEVEAVRGDMILVPCKLIGGLAGYEGRTSLQPAYFALSLAPLEELALFGAAATLRPVFQAGQESTSRLVFSTNSQYSRFLEPFSFLKTFKACPLLVL